MQCRAKVEHYQQKYGVESNKQPSIFTSMATDVLALALLIATFSISTSAAALLQLVPTQPKKGGLSVGQDASLLPLYFPKKLDFDFFEINF